ncbi:MAG TPA: hypothetical protein VIW45_00685 [Vicinamibacterales bacterium]
MSGRERFVRRGRIHRVSGEHEWSRSHCQCPVALPLSDRTVRVYFATRDANNRSSTTYIEADIDRPSDVTYVHDAPCIGPGAIGTFDDAGVMPSWIVPDEGRLLLYYSAWNVGGTVPYRISIGLASSVDGGRAFERVSPAPIMDRSRFDPGWVAQPCVLRVTSSSWMMWYLSCTHWSVVADRPEPHYHVKFAVSTDGVDWTRTGDVSLDYDADSEAIGRPVVLFEDGIYKMYFSYRRVTAFRTDPRAAYRIGYAESHDGIRFERRPQCFELTGPRDEWESVMNEYGTVYVHAGAKYLLYNGNGFGREGIGYAVTARR